MLDETKGTEQDKLQEAGRSSDSKGGSTSKDKVSISKSEHQKLLEDAAASRGRAEKLSSLERERDTLKDRLESTNSRLDNLEREANESRLAEVRGDPDQLKVYQREQATTKREREANARDADLARREEQLKVERAEVDKDRGVVSIAYIAAKHGMETEELESLGISDHDTLERVAEKLAAAKPKESVTGEGEGEGEEFTPDSGVTTGSGEPTMEQLEKMPMGQYAAHVQKRDEKK